MATAMARRVAVAAVGIPAALGLVRLGGWPLVGALGLLGGLGAQELCRLAETKGTRPFRWLAIPAAALSPVAVFALQQDTVSLGFAVAVGAVGYPLIVMAAAVLRRPPEAGPLGAIAVSLLAPVYTGMMPSFVLFLRHGQVTQPWAATWLVFLPLVVVWVCDSAAMGAGAAIGGPKFAPVVSPNKTWAGTIVGSLAGGMVAVLFGWVFLSRVGVVLSPVLLAAFGVVVASVGQVGDLAESLLKREAGVKDSGGFFPGHGGVLDRLDSLYWALPTAVCLLTVSGTL
jgi:phosphatidate cytidylyltransferase